MIVEPIDEIVLTSQCLSFLESHARSNDVESCAVLLGHIQETKNRVIAKPELILLTENAEASRIRFSIDAEILYAIYQYSEHNQQDIIAIFHSHPFVSRYQDLKPSSTDLPFMRLNPCIWLISSGNVSTSFFIRGFQHTNRGIQSVSINKL